MEQSTILLNTPGVPPPPGIEPPPPGEEAQDAASADFPDMSGSFSDLLASMGIEESSALSGSGPALDQLEPATNDELPEDGNPYPEIMLLPLPRQDALRIKWGLGDGLPNVATLSEEELQLLAVNACPIQRNTSLRLFAMLPSGAPWEARLSFEDVEKAQDGIIIGRDPAACQIVIGEDSVSRRHAILEMSRDGLVISDLGSRNGTMVDGHTLSRYERRVPLNDGCTITLGEVTIRVEHLT